MASAPEVVLDSNALLALLRDEAGKDRVREAFERARETGTLLVMGSVNWCETVYALMRDYGEEAALDVAAIVHDMPMAVVDADQDLAIRAGVLKATRRLSLGDAFAAALAIRLGLPLMTGDPDFKALLGDGLELEWIGPGGQPA